MDLEKLNEILNSHVKWLRSNVDGKQADLRGANLQRADLLGADLRRANLRGANLQDTDLRGADLRRADLRRADLRGADLQRANLQRANVDYSCWPLWCGSRGVKVDREIAAQLAAHFCAVDCNDPEYLAARAAVLTFAQTFHEAEELGLK